MTEQAASFAVLGMDIESIGSAVARHWGLDEGVIAMIRRLPTSTGVHVPDNDDEMLRIVGSCANETLEASVLPAPKVLPALTRVAQRYARTLGITLRDLQDALQVSEGLADEDDDLSPLARDLPTLNELV
jgi:non-specific serine/threonine protein kinase